MNSVVNCFRTNTDAEGQRLDVYLTGLLPELNRSRIQQLIMEGNIEVNGRIPNKSGYKLKVGDIVSICLPPPQTTHVVAEAIPLDIVFEDDDLLVINKRRGMVVHPAAGNQQGTLVNALMAHCTDLSGINGVVRPGIVHRLDKDTSGLMLVAKTDLAHLSLAEQIRSHSAGRIYLAVVQGTMALDSGRIEAAIGRHPQDRKKMAVVRQHGKAAITHFQVIERLTRHTVVSCRLETGRTHQIRVHMASIGHPLVGDPKYGAAKHEQCIKGQALHSAEIHFKHPRTGQSMSFSATMPQDMQQLIGSLKKIR